MNYKQKLKKCPKDTFTLSLLALVIGWLFLIGGCAQIIGTLNDALEGVKSATPATSISPLLGLQIIVGTSAYRSIKRRKLGMREESVLRRGGELLALIGVCLPTLAFVGQIINPSQAFLNKAANEPGEVFFIYVIVPLWSSIAYAVMAVKYKVENGGHHL